MNLMQVKKSTRRLSHEQLRRLDEWLHDLIRTTKPTSPKERSSSPKQILEERTHENKTYRLEGIRCGKEKCKCAGGEPHGPYWYSYTREGDKVKSQYIGKNLPREVKKAKRR